MLWTEANWVEILLKMNSRVMTCVTSVSNIPCGVIPRVNINDSQCTPGEQKSSFIRASDSMLDLLCVRDIPLRITCLVALLDAGTWELCLPHV